MFLLTKQAAGMELEEYSEADLSLSSKRQEDDVVENAIDNAGEDPVDKAAVVRDAGIQDANADTDGNEPIINNNRAAERA